jgi:hypothetical protein
MSTARSVVHRVTDSAFVRRDLRAALVPWIVARILVVGALELARYLVDQLHLTGIEQASQGLFAWDGAFYRSIAEHGYGSVPRAGLRFFPGYPLVGRWVGTIFLGHTAVGLLVVASVAALGAGALLHRLTLRETGDVGAAHRAAWYVAVIPAGMAYVLGYAEALLLLCAVGMFLALRSRRWLVAVPFGVVAGLTRPVGLMLFVPALVEVTRDRWERDRPEASRSRVGGREWGARLAAVAAPIIGTGVYLAWVGARYDDPMLPFSVQDDPKLRGGTVDPVTHVVDSLRHAIDGDRFGAGLHLVWIAVVVALLVVVARRLPASYAAYAGAAVLLALTARNVGSFERYAFTTFPLVMGIALLTRRREVDRVVSTLAAAGLAAYCVLAFLGEYVP